MRYSRLCLLAALAAGVAAGPRSAVLDAQAPAGAAVSPASRFLSSLADVCGQAFEGRITANEPAQPNDPFVGQALVMHVRTCQAGRVLVPFHVGADRSRTWVLTLRGDRLRLEHDHRHEDGTADALTMYGGDSLEPGTANRQAFPVNGFSKELFTRLGRSVSNTNTWAMEIHPGRMFAYELRRPGRLFRVEFDLTKPVPAPPAPWGHGPPASPPHPRIAQALELARVWLEAQRAYDQIPGVSAAIVHDQQVLWAGGYGMADVAAKRPAAPDTIYSICSISKLFTSIAVMQQRDAGKVRLDDPVSRHLPWFRIRPLEGESAEVTVEGLLTHASGLPRESDFPYWTGAGFPFPTREQIVERITNQQMLYPAETFFQYSNLGLTLAGEIAAAAAAKPYAELVRQSILDPLGLRSTTPDMPAGERGKRLATGYSGLGREGARQPVPFFSTNGIAPAAGYASTVEDLARFASWQFRLLAKGGTEVLSATTLREMHRVHWIDTDFTNSYGLGFSVWRSGEKTFVGHGGSCPGFRSHLLLKPDEKLATVFMANAQGVNATQYAQRLYDIVGPAVAAAAKEKDKEAKPKVPDAAHSAYVGSYASAFSGTETAVVLWEDGLAMLPLPTTDPVTALVKLRKVGDHTFRRVRKDEALAETITFEMGPDGRALRYVQHSNPYERRR